MRENAVISVEIADSASGLRANDPARQGRIPKRMVAVAAWVKACLLRISGLLAVLGAWAPKGLYARALIIIIAPIVILQSILTFVFLDRHWEFVTKRLSTATAQDIAMLAATYDLTKNNRAELERLTDLARDQLNLIVRFVPDEELPVARPKPFFRFLDRYLSNEIRHRINKPYWIDTVGSSRHVEIRIKLDGAVMRVLAPRAQIYPSNTHIFLVWMVASSSILLTVAVLFLRNQIKPILALADAADRFGRGRPAPPNFRIRGAREVRLAAQAFLEMRNRIERHVEQRTIMLAGVSHDLRTVLTRFRLQLAMLKGAGVEALKRDVDEMQQMLEDYVAFAKGDSGEKTAQVDVGGLLMEICADADAPGKVIEVHLVHQPIVTMLRRNAFKRAIMNLAVNAERFADRIVIRAGIVENRLFISVEDNGPGIPANRREEVFRPFHSLDNARNQNRKSTGLGLAIARDVIRGHGGEITLGDSALGGLKALIEIPLAPSTAEPETSQELEAID